jgi:hypothetical protein
MYKKPIREDKNICLYRRSYKFKYAKIKTLLVAFSYVVAAVGNIFTVISLMPTEVAY